MRINWILPEASQCGGVRVALDYANLLTEMGHDVICYVPKSGQHFGWKRIFFVKEVLKMYRDSEIRGEWFENKFTFEFPMWINDKYVRDADVTIATSWITAYWIKEMCPKKGKKVYFIQDFETWGNEKYNKLVLKTYSFPFDQFITVSTALHDKLLEEIGTNSQVVCNGVEKCFVSKTNKSFKKIVIGMPYREMRGADIKNCSMGIEVLMKIKTIFPSVELHAFGFNKPIEWNDEIDFLENPSREELVKFYNQINIFYVPSVYEGWGLPAMEAMAQENLVLGACSGLIQEIGVDMQNCVILRNPRDKEEAIEKICFLINNMDIVRKIGRNARNSVLEMTTYHSGKRFEHVLEACAN